MNKLLKIGVFYDGNYFSNVSNYYFYQHIRKSRINITGLHAFIKNQVAEEEGVDVKLCKISAAHYFRGRLNAWDARELNKLYYERVIDDLLMKENVTPHYLPLTMKNGIKEEKGVDVSLALEAYELSLTKGFDVVVLIACDGDYIALVQKLNALGVRVMILSWDFNYLDDFGTERGTITSQDLLESATYPLAMHEIIDNRVRRNEPLINNIFKPFEPKAVVTSKNPNIVHDDSPKISVICNLQRDKGYGFITFSPENLFFHFSQMTNVEDYNDMHEGDRVEFLVGMNDRDGKLMAKNVKRLEEEN